uniref:Uncharacterized protein n=1 Tax=Vespula pensylvanica TaxID=30213 RepID=A0A834P4U9_VESPE|nr:hypothetical protein H0235_005528 [Vespula pensylvanica]
MRLKSGKKLYLVEAVTIADDRYRDFQQKEPIRGTRGSYRKAMEKTITDGLPRCNSTNRKNNVTRTPASALHQILIHFEKERVILDDGDGDGDGGGNGDDGSGGGALKGEHEPTP